MASLLGFSRKNTKKSSNLTTVNTNRNNAEALESSPTMSQTNLWELVSKLRLSQDSSEARYRMYETMLEDTVIQSAVELYADDATQVDTKSERIVQITSSNSSLSADLLKALDSINIESRIWNWTYALAGYGDQFLRLHIDTVNKTISADDNVNPSLVFDLMEEGKRVGYAEIDDSEHVSYRKSSNGLNMIVSSPDSFIHFMVRRTYDKEAVEIVYPDKFDEYDDPLIKKYNRVHGVSMIEGVRPIYNILSLLEDSLLVARLAKAEYVRIFNIEVGKNNSNKRVTEVVNSVKNLFDSKANFNVNTGSYESNQQIRPIGDSIFNPVMDGVGAITKDSIGGEFQVRDIADIEYFNNKLFAGLKTPKAYLGFEECLHPSTEIQLVNMENKSEPLCYTIKYMVDHKEEFLGKPVYTCDSLGNITETDIVHLKKTRKNAEYLEINLSSGFSVLATPDHLFMLSSGEFVMAQDLMVNDYLMVGSTFNHQDMLPWEVQVLSVSRSLEVVDAYDLGVSSDNHTFLLGAGIFVHNSLPGGLGDNTLTRLDIRYSRLTKRLQSALLVGIKEFCDIWLRLNNRESEIGNYKVVLQSPSTAEELGRLTELDTKLSIVNNLTSTIATNCGEYINVPKVFNIIMNKYIDYPDLLNELQPLIKEASDKWEITLSNKEEKVAPNSDYRDTPYVDIDTNYKKTEE